MYQKQSVKIRHYRTIVIGAGQAGLAAGYHLKRLNEEFLIIDAAGLVRGMYFGWGRETANEVQNDLRPWLSVR